MLAWAFLLLVIAIVSCTPVATKIVDNVLEWNFYAWMYGSIALVAVIAFFLLNLLGL